MPRIYFIFITLKKLFYHIIINYNTYLTNLINAFNLKKHDFLHLYSY